ncbi:amino acid--tRNA ligase-related protein, partial [Mycoplasmopsis bovis]|uniref:amino acid--tRNA ligase-related protein n=1 Tax=Mycoplasmopsis bovis TaxID=28903 RepID=UPI003D2BD023
WFLKAFDYGVPPHCGIAFGLDRLIMLLAHQKSIWDVIPFPKNSKNQDLLMDAPSPSNRNIIFNFLMEIVGTLVLLIAIVAVGRFVTIPFVVPIV